MSTSLCCTGPLLGVSRETKDLPSAAQVDQALEQFGREVQRIADLLRVIPLELALIGENDGLEKAQLLSRRAELLADVADASGALIEALPADLVSRGLVEGRARHLKDASSAMTDAAEFRLEVARAQQAEIRADPMSMELHARVDDSIRAVDEMQQQARLWLVEYKRALIAVGSKIESERAERARAAQNYQSLVTAVESHRESIRRPTVAQSDRQRSSLTSGTTREHRSSSAVMRTGTKDEDGSGLADDDPSDSSLQLSEDDVEVAACQDSKVRHDVLDLRRVPMEVRMKHAHEMLRTSPWMTLRERMDLLEAVVCPEVPEPRHHSSGRHGAVMT